MDDWDRGYLAGLRSARAYFKTWTNCEHGTVAQAVEGFEAHVRDVSRGMAISRSNIAIPAPQNSSCNPNAVEQ